MTPTRRLYALGLKGYIELRYATRPPRSHLSRKERWVEFEEVYWRKNRSTDFYGIYQTRYRKRKVKRKVTIEALWFAGGKWAGVMPRLSWKRGWGSVPIGRVMEVPLEVASKLPGANLGQ